VQPPAQHLFELSGALDWLSLRGRALANRIARRRGHTGRIAASRRPPDLEVTLALDHCAPRSARNYVRDLLRDESSREVRETSLLLTSEIVTTVLGEETRAPSMCELRVWLPAEVVRVELVIEDGLLAAPRPDMPRYDLVLLDELADSWSIDTVGGLASIWFEVGRVRRIS
jgi:hypothetical protein